MLFIALHKVELFTPWLEQSLEVYICCAEFGYSSLKKGGGVRFVDFILNKDRTNGSEKVS